MTQRSGSIELDGSDDSATRYLVHDACGRLRIPNVHGARQRFDGQVSTLRPERGIRRRTPLWSKGEATR